MALKQQPPRLIEVQPVDPKSVGHGKSILAVHLLRIQTGEQDGRRIVLINLQEPENRILKDGDADVACR